MRIALVDPSRTVQRAMRNLIAKDGHEVLAFCEGKPALEYISNAPTVATLITSVQLPDISGLELCSEARKLASSRRPLVIIVMSSSEEFGVAVKALDNGADDFIHKPPFAEELRARLRAADRVTSMQHTLIRFAMTDSLTGLLNRRAFFEQASEIYRAADIHKPLAAILFDIDHFKRINDTYGHEVGDRVLANVGEVAGPAMNNGLVARLGGEEFCYLDQCDSADAIEIAERVRHAVKNMKIGGYPSMTITCSFGVAEWEPGDDVDRLLRRADIALYEAKTTGRDRVVAMDHFLLTDEHEQWRGLIRAGKRDRQ